MAKCNACGAWYSSAIPKELCPTCERALRQLNGYAVPVVRCKDCQAHEPCTVRNRVWCKKLGRYMKKDGFCSEGVKEE